MVLRTALAILAVVVATARADDTGPTSVTVALAPPSVDVPAPPAPQNEAWSNVSHINGSVVPVGERGEYLATHPHTNFQSNPIAWMFRAYQLAGTHALSANLAASLELSAWANASGSHTGYAVAPTLQLYLKRVFSGPFLEGGLVFHRETENNSNLGMSFCVPDCHDFHSTWFGPELMVGWTSSFDSGLNVSVAVGAARRLTQSIDTREGQAVPPLHTAPMPVGYFRVGYAF